MSETSLFSGLATRFPAEFAQGKAIASGLVSDIESGDVEADSVEEALSLTAHMVAEQKIVGEGTDDMRAVMALMSADAVVREFFTSRQEIRI